MSSTPPQATNQPVKVSLLLTGGHEYTLQLQADDPVLRNLIGTVIGSAQGDNSKSQGLFQIPVDQDRANLCFPSNRLVGIVTEPPIVLQAEDASAQTVITQGPSQAATPKTGAVEPQLKATGQQPQPKQTRTKQPIVLSANTWQIENFLNPAEHQALLQHAVENQSSFTTTTTTTKTAEHRRSQVLYKFPEFSDTIREYILECLPTVLDKVGLEPFPIDSIEAQLTAHNDGDYYKLHNDGGSPPTATRTLTYVYYLYREPKPFCGGELLVYDTKLKKKAHIKSGTYKIIEPHNNSIVFFPSRCLHEVLPIRCPSGTFADSRFTVNGWIRCQT